MRKVGLYIRVSTEEQAKIQEGSLVSQRQRLEEFVKAQNILEANWGRIVSTFVDEAKSGKNTNRPEYQRMLAEIQAGKVDHVLVTELSRLSRSLRDFCSFWDFIKAHGGQFISIREKFDTATAAGEMMMFSIVNFAQFERKQTAERVSANFQARASRGLFNGGCPTLGYDLHPEKKGYLVKNEDEAYDVNRIFEIFRQKGSIASAIDELNRLNIKNKAHTKSDGSTYGGADWTFTSLWRVLTNRHYIGEREINKRFKNSEPKKIPAGKEYKVAKAAWEPIVERTVFEAAQKMLSDNQNRYKPGSQSTFDYLYSSVVYCPGCDQKLVGISGTSEQGKKYVYSAHKTRNPDCAVSRIDAVKLHKVIRKRFKTLANNPKLLDQLFGDARADRTLRLPQQEKRLQTVQKKLKELNPQAENLVNRLQNLPSGYEGELIYTRLAALEAEIKALTVEGHELQECVEMSKDSKGGSAAALKEFVNSWDRNFEKLTSAEKRRFIRIFIGRVDVFPKKVKLRYHWEVNGFEKAAGAKSPAATLNAKKVSKDFSSWAEVLGSLYTLTNGGEREIRTLERYYPLLP